MTAPRPATLAVMTVATLLGCESPPPLEPGGITAGWPVYAADAGGSRHSPLDQINRDNVRFLKEAWRIRTGDLDAEPPPPGHMAFQATPIVVGESAGAADAARPRAGARPRDRRRALALRRDRTGAALPRVHLARRRRVDRFRRGARCALPRADLRRDDRIATLRARRAGRRALSRLRRGRRSLAARRRRRAAAAGTTRSRRRR